MRTKKRKVLFFLEIILILILFLAAGGCTSQQQLSSDELTDQLTDKLKDGSAGVPEKQPLDKQVKKPIGGCDGFCDAFEKEHTESPCYKPDCLGTETEKVLSNEQKNGPVSQPDLEQEDIITVEKTETTYDSITTKPGFGWFKTGQDADLMLLGFGFNQAGGPLSFNHLGVSATDGTHLLVPDRFNNRILIWKNLPTGNTPPDLVLGQKDFYSNNPGTGLDNLNWPVSVSISPDGKMAVADTMNARILLWNSFPTKNGQSADLILSGEQGGGPQKTDLAWPWGVWTDGKRLAVTSTRGSTVLIWNSFPTKDDQKPDLYLTAKNQFGTPRTITSDGKRLIVSDHNAKIPIDGNSLNGKSEEKGSYSGASATFFWKDFPTVNDAPYDFYMPGWLQGEITPEGKVLLMGATAPQDHLLVWNNFPEDGEDEPDFGFSKEGAAYTFETGDGSGIVEIGGKLYISLYNGNKILGYNSFPLAVSQKPDFVIGSPDAETNTLRTSYMLANPQPATDGKSLFAVSDFDRRLYVWKSLPEESGAKPDFSYDLSGAAGKINFQAAGIAVGQKALAIIGREAGETGEEAGVFIWEKLPLNGELPDWHFTGKIGAVNLEKVSGVAIDETYFYLSDELAGKIYVWEGMPTETGSPKFILSMESPLAISSDGKRLLVNTIKSGAAAVFVYDLLSLSSNSKPQKVEVAMQNPTIAYLAKGSLFTASTSNSQVRIWENIESAINGNDPEVVLGEDDLQDEVAEIGKDKLFWPAALAFDGSYLWVGEVKFSSRLVRFSIGKGEE